jgi:hypothetical protein
LAGESLNILAMQFCSLIHSSEEHNATILRQGAGIQFFNGPGRREATRGSIHERKAADRASFRGLRFENEDANAFKNYCE